MIESALPSVRRYAASLAVLVALAAPVSAQPIGDASRLAGVTSVSVLASAEWDELITTTAGGATAAQFEEALLAGFQQALADASPGPAVDDGSTAKVRCHVDTYYESGLIVYAARVTLERPGANGPDVIAWLDGWVGSYTARQLHLIWSIADQCAAAFLGDWVESNG